MTYKSLIKHTCITFCKYAYEYSYFCFRIDEFTSFYERCKILFNLFFLSIDFLAFIMSCVNLQEEPQLPWQSPQLPLQSSTPCTIKYFTSRISRTAMTKIITILIIATSHNYDALILFKSQLVCTNLSKKEKDP